MDFIVNAAVPRNKVYFTTAPHKITIPAHIDVEVKVFDNAPSLRYTITAFEQMGTGIFNTGILPPDIYGEEDGHWALV